MELSRLKKQQRAFYDSLVSRQCPILGETVYFTASGFDHLINKSNSKNHRSYPRNPAEQYLKLQCLSKAPEVVNKSTRIAEARTISMVIKGITKSVTHYELAHTCKNGEDIRVVIERIGNGKCKFLSVFPYRKNKKRP